MKIGSAHRCLRRLWRSMPFPVLAVLLIHSEAFAQQTAPPPPPAPEPSPPPDYGQPQELPPGYGPPPGYGQPPQQPPPGYGQAPPRYPYHYPPPPPPPRPRGQRRGLTLGAGIGFGGLTATDGNKTWSFEGGLSYTFRVGLAVAPNLVLMWNCEGTVTTFRDELDDSAQLNQTAHLAALQIFLLDRLWLKGGIGAAHLDYETSVVSFRGDWGLAGMVGIGFELIQGRNTSLDIEFSSTLARYSDLGETWNNTGLNFAINWY